MKLAAALRALGRVFARGDLRATGIAVPDGDAVPPPELPADAPIPDILHPVVVLLAEVLRMETEPPVPIRGQGGLGQRLHPHEPLLAQPGLDDRATSVAVTHRMEVILDLYQEASGLEILQNTLAGFEPVQPSIRLRRLVGDRAIRLQHVHTRKLVSLADLEVVRIVSRGHLEGPRPEFQVHVLIRDHRQSPAHERQHEVVADSRGMPRVVGVHSHGRVAEHRLGPGRCDDHALLALDGGRIADVVQLARLVAVLDLLVGERRPAARTPVDNVLTPVDQALLIQADEHFPDGSRQSFIERKAGPLPVTGIADLPLLLENQTAVLMHPRPNALDERLAAEIPARHSILRQLPLHDVLGRDSRVVGAGHPHRVVMLHATPADQHILDRVVQPVPHVQNAGHVRRRNRDDVRPLHLFGRNVEESCLLPPPVHRRFDSRRVVSGVELLAQGRPLSRVAWFPRMLRGGV